MDVTELKVILRRIEELYAAAGAATAARDLRSVARLLEGYEGKSVDTFIAETRALLEKAASHRTTAVDAERIASHAERLLEAGIDQTEFDAALAKLDSDPRLGKDGWAAVANRYRNAPTNSTHVYKFKTIREARAAIRDAFIERHEASSKRGIIERITRWAS